MTHTPVFVGIDVSKAQLDLALRPEGRFAVPNTEAGIAQVLTRLRAISPTLVVMEATGGLERPPLSYKITVFRARLIGGAGHLRMARANWAIPQANCFCAVSAPVGGAHEETFEQAVQASPQKGDQ